MQNETVFFFFFAATVLYTKQLEREYIYILLLYRYMNLTSVS